MADHYDLNIQRDADHGDLLWLDLASNKPRRFPFPMREIPLSDNRVHLEEYLDRHLNLLPRVLVPQDESLKCAHMSYITTLQDLLESKDGSFFWKPCQHGEMLHHYYTMSQKFKKIVWGILNGVLYLQKMGYTLKQIDPKNVVFSDEKCDIPQLIYCCMITGKTSTKEPPSQKQEQVSTLVKLIARKFQLISASTALNFATPGNKLCRSMLLFFNYLNRTRDKEEFDYPLHHPIFYTETERVWYVFRIRDDCRTPNADVGVPLHKLLEYMECYYASRPPNWRGLIGRSHNTLQAFHTNSPNTYNYTKVKDFVFMFRNFFVHGNDKVFQPDQSGGRGIGGGGRGVGGGRGIGGGRGGRGGLGTSIGTSKDDVRKTFDMEDYGEMIEEICPVLLPAIFEILGPLLKRKEKS